MPLLRISKEAGDALKKYCQRENGAYYRRNYFLKEVAEFGLKVVMTKWPKGLPEWQETQKYKFPKRKEKTK